MKTTNRTSRTNRTRGLYAALITLALAGCGAPPGAGTSSGTRAARPDDEKGVADRVGATLAEAMGPGIAFAGPALPAPKPGADLAGTLAEPGRPAMLPDRSVPVVDLGADRPTVAIDLPDPPPGTTARFTLEDGRAGWIARLPHGYEIPTPAYGDGRVYVSGGFETTSFYALDATTGAFEWMRHGLEDNGPTAAMYVDDQVVFNTESCTLFVLDAVSGKTLWRRWLGDPTLAQPAVADGLVFAAYPGAGPKFGAFRLGDGKPVWAKGVDGEVIGAPVIAEDAVFISTIKGTTYRFRRKDGKREWSTKHGASSPPWYAGGELFLSRTKDGSEIQVVLDAASGDIRREARSVLASGYMKEIPRSLASWKKVWAFEGSRPVVAGGRRFDTMGGSIVAADPLTSAGMWTRRYADGVGKRKITAPAVAGAKIFFATFTGELYGLDVDTGMTVWAYDLGLKVGFQPIVAEGWVYVATSTGSVIGLELGDKSLDGWHMWGGNPAHNGPVL